MSKTDMKILWSCLSGLFFFFGISIFEILLAEHLKISNSMISYENVKVRNNSSGELASFRFMVGLNVLRDFFQAKWFCDLLMN